MVLKLNDLYLLERHSLLR